MYNRMKTTNDKLRDNALIDEKSLKLAEYTEKIRDTRKPQEQIYKLPEPGRSLSHHRVCNMYTRRLIVAGRATAESPM